MDEGTMEELRDHIADCTACSESLLEFSRMEDENQEDPSVTGEELDLSWEKMQKRLRSPGPSPPSDFGSRRGRNAIEAQAAKRDIGENSFFWRWAGLYRTKALAGAAVGLLAAVAYLGLENARLTEPQIIRKVHELPAQTRGGEAPETSEIRLNTSQGGSHLLVFGYQETFPEYEIEILDQSGARPLWKESDLPEPKDEDFIILMPPGALDSGRYLLRLYGLDTGSRTLLSEYDLIVD
jgi:hypothetical protein